MNARVPLLLVFMVGCTEPPARTLEVGDSHVGPSLSFSPGRLNFAGVTSRSVEFRNHTRRDLALTSLSFSSAGYSTPTIIPLSVPANGVASLVLDANSPVDGALTVTTDAIDVPEVVIPLLANRTTPCLSAAPLDFAPVENGCPGRDERVVITNTCPHQVMLTSATTSAGFGLVSAPLGSIEADGSVDLALRHVRAPSGVVAVSADVLDGTQVLSVPLSGVVTPEVIVEEAETIPPYSRRDVLFVIDDSAAMVPFADSVRRNLGDFARISAVSGYDVRIGVMTTSTAPAELGHLRGWLENPTPPALEALATVRGLSTSRSSCLEALLAAFTPPLRAELAGMLRPRVGLQVVCITNTRDAIESAPMSAISSLLTLLPRPRVIDVVAHFVDAPGCDGVVDSGPLSALAAQTDGRREEICTSSWIGALDPSVQTFGYRTQFFLHQRPSFARGPLQVSVDDAEVPPELSGAILWEYSGLTNEVNFEPFYTPGPGQTVRFRYTPDCL